MPSPKDTKGPIVKTGPTAGQNRSRNQDGEWRKKRDDSGKPRSNKEPLNEDSLVLRNTRNDFYGGTDLRISKISVISDNPIIIE